MPYTTISAPIIELAKQETSSNLIDWDRVAALLHSGVEGRYACPMPLLLENGNETPQQRILMKGFAKTLASEAAKLAGQGLFTRQGFDADLALFEALFIFNPAFHRAILYPGYASGDMYGVGASLILDDKMCAIIIKDTRADRPDRTPFVKGFFTSFIPEERIKVFEDAKPEAMASIPAYPTNEQESAKSKAAAEYRRWLSGKLWDFMLSKTRLYCTVDLFFGTNYIARLPRSYGQLGESLSARRKVQIAWETLRPRLSLEVENKITRFIASKGLELRNGVAKTKNIIVLWVRFTGKQGGAHVEYDTSFTGLRELIEAALTQGNDYVIITGDKPKISNKAFSDEKKQARALKLQTIRESFGSDQGRIIDLTEFWKEPEWVKCFPREPRRIDQFKLFEILHKNSRVKHFGARSGNLESLALLGYSVRYFEDVYDPTVPGSLDKKRMEPWHGPVGYNRIQLSKVPTSSGQYLLAQKDNYPKWTYDKRESLDTQFATAKERDRKGNGARQVPDDASVQQKFDVLSKALKQNVKPLEANEVNYPRGFGKNSKDLEKIKKFFKPKLT